MEKHTRKTSIGLTEETWLHLRRLQEQREIRSIQNAVDKGLRLLFDAIKRGENPNERRG